MKVLVVLGTRPEIVKMAPVIKELQRQRIGFFILHTGQHYSYRLDSIFFDELELPEPKYNLDTGSGTHAEETGRMLIGIEKVLQIFGEDTLKGGDECFRAIADKSSDKMQVVV